jgi:hypothetical protein
MEGQNMRATKNDLSFGKATLDYKAMLLTAKYAVSELTEKCSRNINNIRETGFSNNMTTLHLNATWLKEAATGLETCAETLATLQGVLDNRAIEVTNTPEVIEN